MRRILGLDYGTKTVGVALSDELHITAQPLETITRKDANKLRKTYARIEELVKEYNVEKIVLGLPKNMNNTVGERGEDTLSFRLSASYRIRSNSMGRAPDNSSIRESSDGKRCKTRKQKESDRSDRGVYDFTGIFRFPIGGTDNEQERQQDSFSG